MYNSRNVDKYSTSFLNVLEVCNSRIKTEQFAKKVMRWSLLKNYLLHDVRRERIIIIKIKIQSTRSAAKWNKDSVTKRTINVNYKI